MCITWPEGMGITRKYVDSESFKNPSLEIKDAFKSVMIVGNEKPKGKV